MSQIQSLLFRNYWLARLLSFKRPLLSVEVSVCVSVFDVKYLGNETIQEFASNRDPIGKCLRRVGC